MTAQAIPKDAQHAPGNSPSNTAMIVEMRKRDVKLVWMGVLSRSQPTGPSQDSRGSRTLRRWRCSVFATENSSPPKTRATSPT